MKILVTGSNGFIGKNLIAELKNQNYTDILPCDLETDPALLDDYCREAEFVFHLAGVNRPKDPAEFLAGNFGFTSVLLAALKKHGNTCPVMLASSIQAALPNPYGESKKAGEDLLFAYAAETEAEVLVYRFPNVFGKWCRQNYNSAVATFCYNIAHSLPIQVNDRSAFLNLVYIDDVVEELIRALKGNEHRADEFCIVPVTYTITLGEIVDLIYSFKESRGTLSVPNMASRLKRSSIVLISVICLPISSVIH